MPDDYQGAAGLSDGASDFNLMHFVARMVLSGAATAEIVQVMAVGAGTVDVQPCVAMIDGQGNASPHGMVHGLPYGQMQGGTAAFKVTPVIGDLGIAVYASRDISSVKATRGQANPGSRRQFSRSDGMYVCGILGANPTTFVEVKPGTVNVTATSAVNVTAPVVNLGGAGGKAVARVGDTVANGVITSGSNVVTST